MQEFDVINFIMQHKPNCMYLIGTYIYEQEPKGLDIQYIEDNPLSVTDVINELNSNRDTAKCYHKYTRDDILIIPYNEFVKHDHLSDLPENVYDYDFIIIDMKSYNSSKEKCNE